MKTKTTIALLITALSLTLIGCNDEDISPSERSKSGKTSSSKTSGNVRQEKERVPS